MRALLVFTALLVTCLGVPAAEDECKNGGVLKGDECECQSYWGGKEAGPDGEPLKNDCSVIECVNGGYPVPYDTTNLADGWQVCHCPRGYYGIHCDAVKQARPVEGVFKTKQSDSPHRTFNLYIHNELTDWYGMSALERIQRDINDIVPDYERSFDKYHLFTSSRGNPVEADNAPLTLTEFKAAVNGLGAKRTSKYTCDQTNDISYASLLTTLQTNKIEDSVILMFTQYPPKKDDKSLAELKKYLRAFRIKLNVLIGADDILLDCNSKKKKGSFDDLASLVHFTDGEIASFLVEDKDDKNELLPSFIRASASPQSHSRISSKTCTETTLEFRTDPYPNTYYIAVRSDENKPASITGTCSSGGELSDPIQSYYEEFTIFTILSGAQQSCELKVTTGTECLATVYSVGGEKDVDSFDIFHSFTTSVDMDTDSISSFQDEELFVTMHIEVPDDSKYKIKRFEGDVKVKNEIAQDVILESFASRGSTFEYYTEKSFACPEEGSSWIQLTLNGFNNIDDKPVAVLNRIIHLNCEERTKHEDLPKMFRLLDEEFMKPKTTLALMYSNQLPTSQFSRFILESVDPGLMEGKFTKYGSLRFDARDIENFRPTDDFNTFRKAVYDNAPDIDIPFVDTLKQHLEKLTSDSAYRLTSDSLVSIAIEHPMSDPDVVKTQYPSNLAELANLGARFLFWGDLNTIKLEEISDSLEVYTRIAAISAGHVILMDMDDFDEDDVKGGEPYYISLALRAMYSFGPSQRLLSYSNLQWNQESTMTSQSSPIGSLQIPEVTTQVFVSLTLNVNNPSDISAAFMLTIVLDGSTDRIVLEIDKFTQYGPPGFARSNLYTANVTVVGGETYEGTFTVLAMTPFTGAHIRFWVDRGEEEIPVLTYKDFDEKTIQPDDFVGAALRVQGTEGETISVRFLDENGQDAIRLDHEQEVEVDKSGIAYFVPYFCNSNQSDDLSKDVYTVEIKYSATNFTYYRPMLCTASGKKNVDGCDVTDDDGNVFCQVSNPPFVRGPSGILIDCSGVGQVYYDSGAYKCNCITGFSGVSCQSSSCSADITHLPMERDATFRTLTFVFISPAGDTDPPSCTYIFQNYAADAKNLFTGEYDNIWQFTFLMYFNDGNVKTMYRGSRLSEFLNVFDYLMSDEFGDIADTFCGVDVKQKPIEIADVYNYAVESVGRDSRGIIFFYASQAFLETKVDFQLDKLTVSEDFYQTVQAYQQHIYMISPVITEDMVALTTASGGVAIKMIDDYTNNFKENPALKELKSIITGEIGWIGVHTKNTDREWVIKDDVKLFISSNTTFPDISDCGTAAKYTAISFPSDADDDDLTKSAVFSIAGTSQKICLKFTSTAPDTLLQVVALSIKSPIQHALIGQGQADVDKHSAGATTNSSKPIHISFDRPEEKFKIAPISTNWRQAARDNCTFAQEFIPFENPFEESGSIVIDFNVTETTDTGSVKYSLAVPLVVSVEIRCVNGKFNHKGSYCECVNGWSGPTCSQPSCGDGGRLNSHGDHCDCTGAEFGGLFCTGKTSNVQENDEE